MISLSIKYHKILADYFLIKAASQKQIYDERFKNQVMSL